MNNTIKTTNDKWVGHQLSWLQTRIHRIANRSGWINVLWLAPLFAGVYALGWWLRFEGQWTDGPWNQMLSTVGCVVIIKLAVFVGVYGTRHWGRFLTFQDLGPLAQASTASSISLLAADFFLFPESNIPRSVFLLDWGVTIVAIGAVRAATRWFQERGINRASSNDQPVLIIGANENGESLLRMIRRSRKMPYRVEGFVAEHADSVGTFIGGVRVIGVLDQVTQLAHDRDIRELFLTAGELSGKQVRQLIDDVEPNGINLRVLPRFEQILDGSMSLRPREVSIEDLLGRAPVQLNNEELRDWIDGRVLLVTGSAGSIGSEICRQLLRCSPSKLVMLDRSETGQFFLEREIRKLKPEQNIEIVMADAQDTARLRSIFEEHRPDIVFHAAAYKHVPLMEQNRGEAIKNIVTLTRNLADISSETGVQSFVMISTDKAVNPTSTMGACKRVAELYVQSLADTSTCRFVTVRFGNVLGSAGSVIPVFKQQIAAGGPVTVTHQDMVRYFMTIPEAAQLVIQAGCMGQGGEIFVLDMGQPVKIMDLARDVIQLSGLTVGEDIEIEITGMRPGEKLYEELHIHGEQHVQTSNPKIMVANSMRMNRFQTNQAAKRLANLADGPDEFILHELKTIVPQFQHELLPSTSPATSARRSQAA